MFFWLRRVLVVRPDEPSRRSKRGFVWRLSLLSWKMQHTVLVIFSSCVNLSRAGVG